MSATGDNWAPQASIHNLQRRAQVLAQVRAFFASHQVMEVDTPILSHCAVSDPFIDSMEVGFGTIAGQPESTCYLQTSPEYAMKRLLAAGSGPIYQLGHVYRNGEAGRRHNPEFTMLEWYRPGFDDNALMDEVEALVATVLGKFEAERISYRDLFRRELNIDPLTAETADLVAICRQQLDVQFDDDSRDTWLELIMSHLLEPRLVKATFVHSFPASQAALSRLKVDSEGMEVATRFELYVGGVELANGYHELTDAKEQARRLEADQARRAELQLPQRPLDYRLVAALEQGLPDCAGVALGFDRLMMLALATDDIGNVLPFSFERA